jgi:flagellar basal-body rod protein FlgB
MGPKSLPMLPLRRALSAPTVQGDHRHMQIFTDRTMAALQAGLTGEAQRQRVTSDNIANVNTPGYRAKRVDFETSLSQALDRKGSSTVSIDHSLAEPWASLNGNTVSLEAETAVMVKSGLHYEALVSAVNHRFSVTSTAIGVK